MADIPPLNSLSIWEFVNAAVQMKLKTKYTSSYLAIDTNVYDAIRKFLMDDIIRKYSDFDS